MGMILGSLLKIDFKWEMVKVSTSGAVRIAVFIDLDDMKLIEIGSEPHRNTYKYAVLVKHAINFCMVSGEEFLFPDLHPFSVSQFPVQVVIFVSLSLAVA